MPGAVEPFNPPPPVSPDFGKLNGLSGADITRLLGEPDFRRQEPPALVWQYRAADCVLDLVLYGEPGFGDASSLYRVAYAQTRDRGQAKISQATCYQGLVEARAKQHPSQL